MKQSFFPVSLYSIRNSSGFGADISDLGGLVYSIVVPDRDGKPVDVALGWRDTAVYLENPGCLGELVGRVANRIGGANFVLDGKNYKLPPNENGNLLHGGMAWFRRLWQVEEVDAATLKLRLVSPDGDGGFPGRVAVEVVYHMTEDNALELTFSALPDRPTFINLTNHTYFNLNGKAADGTDDHLVRSTARVLTAVDKLLIPTGDLTELSGTPLDLADWKSFADIRKALPGGFDHNLVIGTEDVTLKNDVVTVKSPRTGIVLKLSTTAPGVQFYMAGMMKPLHAGKDSVYGVGCGFCLETQHWPDAPNHANFPSIRFTPEHPYYHKCVYAFSTEK